MYGKMDSISCMMEFTEILKNEPSKAKEYIELNLLRKVNNYFYLFYFLSQNIFAYHK